MTSEHSMERRPSKLVISTEDPVDLLRELAERNPRAISPELHRALGNKSLGGTGINEIDGENND